MERKERLKISDLCCKKLKKDVSDRYSEESGRKYCIIGTRTAEGGARRWHSGCMQMKNGDLNKFKPLNPVDNGFMEWYIETRNIKLCKLYYPPFNFKRTGCKGCPFAIDLKSELDIIEKFMPAEYKQCEYLWHPVYEEYRSHQYRSMHKPNRLDDPKRKKKKEMK